MGRTIRRISRSDLVIATLNQLVFVVINVNVFPALSRDQISAGIVSQGVYRAETARTDRVHGTASRFVSLPPCVKNLSKAMSSAKVIEPSRKRRYPLFACSPSLGFHEKRFTAGLAAGLAGKRFLL